MSEQTSDSRIKELTENFCRWFRENLSIGGERIDETNYPRIQNMVEFYLTMAYYHGRAIKSLEGQNEDTAGNDSL